jgi:phosphoglycolate phosphatase-like HAD superfamily hydrolase
VTALTEVIARTRTLFLDFDGPICGIFAGYPAPTVAAELRHLLHRNNITISADMQATDDPIEVLKLAAKLDDPAVARLVADALRDAEVTAAETAEATPHADDVIHAALDTGRRLAVVSNNSTEAVTAYLKRQGLDTSFARIIGRYDGMSVDFLKPSNHLLALALIGSDAPPWSTTLVGDSTTDITAARSVPISAIGYANKPDKTHALNTAGADAVIASMAELADAMHATPPHDERRQGV